MATEAHRPVLFNKLMQCGIYHTVAIKNPSLLSVATRGVGVGAEVRDQSTLRLHSYIILIIIY